MHRVKTLRVGKQGFGNMVGTEYEGLGSSPGLDFLELIRTSKNTTDVQAVHKSEDGGENDPIFSGQFYDQDCYLFLHTRPKTSLVAAAVVDAVEGTAPSYGDAPATNGLFVRGGQEVEWRIYIWKGEKASLIQFGMAGTKANNLLKKLVDNGNYYDCEVIKMTQGNEKQEFLSLFEGSVLTVLHGSRQDANNNIESAPNSPLGEVMFNPKLPLTGSKVNVKGGKGNPTLKKKISESNASTFVEVDYPDDQGDMEGYRARGMTRYESKASVSASMGGAGGMFNGNPGNNKLFMVNQDRLTRVPIREDIIKRYEDRNFILDVGDAVYSYSGPMCGRVERAYTEEMARRRCKADYRKKIKAHHIHYDDAKAVKNFFKAVNDHQQPVWQEWEDADENEKGNLFTVELHHYNAETNQLEAVPNTNSEAERSFLFDAEMLIKNEVFVLDCTTEIYVWIGKGIPQSVQQQSMAAATSLLEDENSDHRPSFVQIEMERQNMESVYFKERFFGFDQTDLLEIGGQIRNIKNDKEFMIYAKDNVKKTRRVSGELRRVIQFLEERENDFYKDQELYLSEDTSGKLIALRFDQKGNQERMEEWEYGFFETTEMYCYIYSCKNDTLNYVFTWEGEHASVRAKTVAGIATTGKDVATSFTDQLMGTKVFKFVQQGKEPRLLTYLLDQRDKNLFLRQGVPTEKQRNQGVVQEIFFDKKKNKIYAFEINEIGQWGARTCEIPFRNLQRNGLSKKCCYLIYRGPAEKQNINALNIDHLKPTDIFFFVGEKSAPDAKKLVKKLANDPVLPRSFGYQSFATLDVYNIDLNDVKNKKFWGADELGIFLNQEELLPPPTRATRLISVSHALKEVGAMFIHDIGNGAFSQTDLKQNDVFMLDTGSTILYLWIGSEASSDSVELGLETAARYLTRMLPKLKQYKDKNVKPEVELQLVDSGDENMAFTSCFYGWKNFPVTDKKLSTKFETKIIEYFELAHMNDKKRKEAEKVNALKQQNLQLQEFKKQQELRRKSMKTLKRGKLVQYKKSILHLSILDKVGDRIALDGNTNTITVSKLGKPLVVHQGQDTLDDLCTDLKDKKFDWVLFGYQDEANVEFVTTGVLGANGLMQEISNRYRVDDKREDIGDNVFYAMLRINATDLDTNLTKADRTLFIAFIPETTKPILRAAVNVHRPFMAEMLGPFFQEVIIRNVAELDQEKAIAIASKGQ